MADDPPDAAARKEAANRLIAYHSPIAEALTVERTSYHSQLIPVTAYILVACAETFARYPDMMRAIDAALPAERIGAAGHFPGSRVNSVHLWSIANFFLTGRKIMTAIDPALDDADAVYTVLDFWDRAAAAFRHDDGTRKAHDAEGVVRPYPDAVLAELLAGVAPVADDAARAQIKRFNATLVNYLFLLYFDTRVGAGDVGPYPLPDGRVAIVRDYYRMGRSDFWWSDVAAEVPYDYLTAVFVLEGVQVRITDFGSSNTIPEDYLDHLVGFGLFTTDPGARSDVSDGSDAPDGSDRRLRPVDPRELADIAAVVRRVTTAHYRNLAAMTRDEMIRGGAYVYFTFLRPFAEVAGVADALDWEVPKAVPAPLYDLLSAVSGEDVSFDAAGAYYELLG